MAFFKMCIRDRDKGKKGKVLEAMPAAGKVVVEGVNVATCHVTVSYTHLDVYKRQHPRVSLR